MATSDNEKICWACKRVIVGDSQMGLCPSCVNRYGSPAAAAAIFALGLGLNFARQNKDKIASFVVKIVKK